MTTLSRRDLLKGLFGGAALAATPAGLLVPEEPQERVRRYWQVGAQLGQDCDRRYEIIRYNHNVKYNDTANSLFQSRRGDCEDGGLVPVEGQPGYFLDKRTGQKLTLGDFRESDKFDTITIGDHEFDVKPAEGNLIAEATKRPLLSSEYLNSYLNGLIRAAVTK